jgi:hypothetical protein
MTTKNCSIENWKKKNNIDYAEGLPKIEDATKFWTAIWGQPQEHNRDANWLHNEQERVRNISNMEQTRVTEEDVQEAIEHTSNWKAPGTDLIQNSWFKKLTVIHKTFATCINKLLQHPEDTPEFLTKGNTYLIPKDNNTLNPSKYRPITCLVSLYKLITAIIIKIYKHLHANSILTEEKKRIL